MLLSAGFDGGNGDVGNLHTGLGEGGLDLDDKETPALLPRHAASVLTLVHGKDFKWATEKILAVADVCCNGRVVSCLEGGYGCREKRPKDAAKALICSLFCMML